MQVARVGQRRYRRRVAFFTTPAARRLSPCSGVLVERVEEALKAVGVGGGCSAHGRGCPSLKSYSLPASMAPGLLLGEGGESRAMIEEVLV